MWVLIGFDQFSWSVHPVAALQRHAASYALEEHQELKDIAAKVEETGHLKRLRRP